MDINIERRILERRTEDSWEYQHAINEKNEESAYRYLKMTNLGNEHLSLDKLLWLLRLAVKNSENLAIHILLARKPNLQNTEGGQLLWLALDDGRENCTFDNNTKIAFRLISAGADLSVRRTVDSSSLLHALASSENELRHELALLILERQADINYQNTEGKTVFESAIEGGSAAVIMALIQKGATIRPEDTSRILHAAASCGNQDLALLMIEHGADVNYRNAKGETVLHSAIRIGSVSIVEAVIKKGAKIDIHQNTAEQYPLHVACRYCSVEIIQLLLNLGADVNITDKNGYTPYSMIVKNEYSYDPERTTLAKTAMAKYFALSVASGNTVNQKDLWAVRYLEIVVVYSSHERTLFQQALQNHLPEDRMRLTYDACIQELDRMKKLEIIAGVSYHDFLTKSIDKLIGIIRRTDLIDNIKKQLLNSFFVVRNNFTIYHRNVLIKYRTVRNLKKTLVVKELELEGIFQGILPSVVTSIIAQYTCLYEYYANESKL